MRELVIAGGPTHLQTFDVPEGVRAIMVAEPAEATALMEQYLLQGSHVQMSDYAAHCPIKRYVISNHGRIAGTADVITHPQATDAEINEAAARARSLHLGWVPIL